MPRTNRLAERLKELRKAKGLTQRDMARHFRLSDVGYGGWERGDTEPSIDNIMRLCEILSSAILRPGSPPRPKGFRSTRRTPEDAFCCIA